MHSLIILCVIIDIKKTQIIFKIVNIIIIIIYINKLNKITRKVFATLFELSGQQQS